MLRFHCRNINMHTTVHAEKLTRTRAWMLRPFSAYLLGLSSNVNSSSLDVGKPLHPVSIISLSSLVRHRGCACMYNKSCEDTSNTISSRILIAKHTKCFGHLLHIMDIQVDEPPGSGHEGNVESHSPAGSGGRQAQTGAVGQE